MAVIRTRFIFWLLKAYIKKWGKLFIVYFSVGLFIFILIIKFSPILISYIPLEKKTKVGVSGAYTFDEIPHFISDKAARGLTKISDRGDVLPDLAKNWGISDSGRTYTFYLKEKEEFTNGTPFNSQKITYSFKDVEITRPDDYTIVFKLKDEYAPFLQTVSKPIFIEGYIGTGEYKIINIDLNGNFVKSIKLLAKNNKFSSLEYVFFPTADALKTALALGEISYAYGLQDTKIGNSDLHQFPNFKIEKKEDFSKLVTLFFNTQDPVLSDKKWRNGLIYALPDDFPAGIRNYNPYPPNSKFYNDSLTIKKQDFVHANLLIKSALETASSSAKPQINLKTLEKYKGIAEIIKKQWKKIDVNVKIDIVTEIPEIYQAYLGEFNVPSDPDQYTLWHSGQINNITKLKNLRIDKLLEDGRRNTNLQERINIYSDFQKYLADESPAAFLYFPYIYNVNRD